jgi:anti-sigma factor RsiW
MVRKFHLSDEKLLLAMDGELRRDESAQVESHLAACWACRTRKGELEAAIGDFVRCYSSSIEDQLPPVDGPRALLRTRLRQAEDADRLPANWLTFLHPKWGWTSVFAVPLVAVAVVFVWNILSRSYATPPVPVTLPNRSLTPGATIALSQPEVCQQTSSKNKQVSKALQKAVFAE